MNKTLMVSLVPACASPEAKFCQLPAMSAFCSQFIAPENPGSVCPGQESLCLRKSPRTHPELPQGPIRRTPGQPLVWGGLPVSTCSGNTPAVPLALPRTACRGKSGSPCPVLSPWDTRPDAGGGLVQPTARGQRQGCSVPVMLIAGSWWWWWGGRFSW